MRSWRPFLTRSDEITHSAVSLLISSRRPPQTSLALAPVNSNSRRAMRVDGSMFWFPGAVAVHNCRNSSSLKVRARRLAARLDAHKRARRDHPALDGEREHPARYAKHAIGEHCRAAIADGIKQQNDVAPRYGVNAQIADRRQHVTPEQPLVLGPRTLVRLGVAFNVFAGEGGAGRQSPLCFSFAALFRSRIAALADDGVPCERLGTRVGEPDLTGVADGTDARLAAELISLHPALPAAGENTQVKPRGCVILDVAEVQWSLMAQFLDGLCCELHDAMSPVPPSRMARLVTRLVLQSHKTGI
jgi:hypothetical protein